MPIVWRNSMFKRSSSQITELKKSLHCICQLCKRKVYRLVCDHDHTTELARGFVCDVCNLHLIPGAERRPELASPAVLEYLRNPPLAHLNITYKNKKEDYYIGNRCGWPDTGGYCELLYHDEELAQIRTHQEDNKWVSLVEIKGKQFQ